MFVKTVDVNFKSLQVQNIVMHIVQIYKIKYNVLIKKDFLLINLNIKNICKIVQESEINKKKKIVYGIMKILIKIIKKLKKIKINNIIYQKH